MQNIPHRHSPFQICLTGLLLLLVATARAQQPADSLSQPHDTVNHWGFTLGFHPGRMAAMNPTVKKWLKKTRTTGFEIEAHYVTLPSDSNAFASDFGYPAISFGLRYTYNGAVRMHRDADTEWDMLVPVDYDSHLGNTVTAYTKFIRPLFRTRHWEAAYLLGTGIGYNKLKYNTYNDIDNELIGSRWLIYFCAGASIVYHPEPDWGIGLGIEFAHHSNGALNRPNKGSNALGPTLSVSYTPYYETVATHAIRIREPFQRHWYMNFTGGFGGKALVEDWYLTQFHTPPGDKNYRTDDFTVYGACSAQADLMFRYARRWASGIGLDLFYGSYWKRTRELDEAKGYHLKHSPWSVGLSAKHEVFFNNWSLPMSIGFYLYRHMGHTAKRVETPYYERVGLRYHFNRLAGLTAGFDVCAHLGKANFTEFTLGIPLVLNHQKQRTAGNGSGS